MDNTLIIEEINEEIKESPTAEVEEKINFCLNCGTEINDRFCPHCGQSTSTPSKLKMKNFGKGVIMSFGRLTPGFINTAKGLMFHPWTVIRDHIRGRHVPYSPPITMLIQIFLYSTIIFAGLDSMLGTNTNIEESLFGYKGDNAILKMIDTSVVISTLLVGIPLCFGVYLAYYRHGAKKFNFAEYLTAFIYLFAAISLWDSVLTFIGLIARINFDLSNLTILIAIIFSTIILVKAFPQKKWWISAGLFMWCGVILLLCFLLVGFLIILPRLIAYLSSSV